MYHDESIIELNVGSEATAQTYIITEKCGNISVEAPTSNWCSTSYNEPSGVITINIEENTGSTSRNEDITIRQNGNECRTISVTQDGTMPNLVFISNTVDVWYNFGQGTPEPTDENKLAKGVPLTITSDKTGLNILAPRPSETEGSGVQYSFTFKGENEYSDYIYLDAMGYGYPGQEVSSFYNVNDGYWFDAGINNQAKMMLDHYVVCPEAEPDQITASTTSSFEGSYAEILVEEKELFMTTYNMEQFPKTGTNPFTMRAILSKIKYECTYEEGICKPDPAFKNDSVKDYPILFQLKSDE